MSKDKKVALLILDGWGIAKDPKRSAIDRATLPFYDSLLTDYPHSTLVTYGEEVGLPEGQMGNSEVGHLNIGAGRVVYQDLAKINKAITDNTLKDNPVFVDALKHAVSNKKPLHLMGLLSDGGVHSHIDHLFALIDIASSYDIPKIYVHAFLDGRDTAPNGGKTYLERLENHIAGKNVSIATVLGRYYAMDRDNRWERIKKAYDLLINGAGEQSTDICKSVQAYYDKGVTDEFMEPILLDDSGMIRADDVVLFFNYRNDRPRQITKALTQEDFPDFDMEKRSLYFVTATLYDAKYKGVKVMFEKENIKNSLGEVLASNDKTQLRIAETEKYPHVTFFFSGGREEAFIGESRELIPSPKVATYDMQPAMGAVEIKDRLLSFVNKNHPDFVCLNFANTDMVGHTGIVEAAIEAAEVVDECLKEMVPQLLKQGYDLLIIADHGNSDIIVNEDGSPHTAHTTNPVPIIYVSEIASKTSLKAGKLGDIATTILSLMNVEAPKDMTGSVLIS